MTLFIIYLAIAVVLSFICSIIEAVLLSITPAYIGIQMESRPQLGKALQQLKDNIDKPLSAILTINTFAHTIGAAGAGAQAQLLWGNQYLTLVSALLTLVILIFSEIIPKTLGASYWKQLAPLSAQVLKLMIYSVYPLVKLGQIITRIITNKNDESVLSRADFRAITAIAAKHGVFRENESKIIQNLLRFNNIVAKDIMTPRTVMIAVPESMTYREFHSDPNRLRFSRIPVYKDNIDSISGYVLKDEVLAQLAQRQDADLATIRRDFFVTSLLTPIPDIFRTLMTKKEHIALVIDEYGGTAGVVSLEDIIETLLGMEIRDESDNVDDLQLSAKRSWERKAERLNFIEPGSAGNTNKPEEGDKP